MLTLISIFDNILNLCEFIVGILYNMNDRLDIRVELIALHMLPGEGYVASIPTPRDAINYDRFRLRITGPVLINERRRWLLFYSKGKNGKGEEDKKIVWKTHRQTQGGEIFVMSALERDLEVLQDPKFNFRFGEPEVRDGVTFIPVFTQNPFKEKHPYRKRSGPTTPKKKVFVDVSSHIDKPQTTQQVVQETKEDKVSILWKETHILRVMDRTLFNVCWGTNRRNVDPNGYHAMIMESPSTGARVYVIRYQGEYVNKDESTILQFKEKFVVTKLP